MTSVRKPKPRAAMLTTASIVSFSLTLLGGGVAVLAGIVPMNVGSIGERTDVGAMLLIVPVVALVLAVCFEVARVALNAPDLPEPRRQRVVRWTPGQREG